jgi:hypothetical protein
MTKFPRRKLPEVLRQVMDGLGGRAPITLIREAVKNTASHAEWESWAENSITHNIRAALRASGHHSIQGEYTAERLFTVADYVLLARAEAQRGREFFDKVRRLAVQCEAELGETFDAEAIIADALDGLAS